MASEPTVQDTLQTEFSPPLDTSLIAAIVADYISGNDARKGDELRQLRDVLRNLAAEAEKELVRSDEQSYSPSSQLLLCPSLADDDSSSFDCSTTDNSGYTSNSSGTSESGQQHFSSPLGFLHALFPQVSPEKLKTTLAAHGECIDDLDMEVVVEELLTSEYMRELEERGLDESESREMGFEAPWELVEKKKKGAPKQKKQNKKGMTIRLVDVRQQQHVRPTYPSSRPAPPDPWTQLASVAAHLSSLIPSHSPAYFQSVFHAPQYTTPAHALRAAVIQIGRQLTKSSDELTEAESPLLFSMFEVLTTSPMYAVLNVEERDQLLEDALFALRATGGNPNTALDLVQLLIELDADFSSKEYAWGFYHQQAPQPKATTKLPSGPPPIPPPPNIRRLQTVPGPSGVEKSRTPPNTWQTVPVKAGPEGPHPLSGVIRAYSNQVPSPTAKKVKGSGNGLGKVGKSDAGELPPMSRRAATQTRYWELFEQRRAAMREAGKAWQRGDKNYGGEIAYYFAERARELQQQQQQQQLDAARNMVMRTRAIRSNRDSIDLHGTIVVEAVAICREYLAENWNGKPVQIITGRGSHSKNGVGVLGPAVRNALASDGWVLDTQEGSTTVRGMRSDRR